MAVAASAPFRPSFLLCTALFSPLSPSDVILLSFDLSIMFMTLP
jgi:hypothetical protein